jgi:hypothetical protein
MSKGVQRTKITGCINCPYAKKSGNGQWLCVYSIPTIIDGMNNWLWNFFPVDCAMPVNERRGLPK